MLKVYSLPHCSQCKKLKKKLEECNIQFEEIIDENLILELAKKTSIFTAPICEENGEYFDFSSTIKRVSNV